MKSKPANKIQDLQFFGEFGGVNPSISEISESEQEQMGLSEGLIRFSVGLDQDIERTYLAIRECIKEFKLL